jgi:hypothetical protein
MNKAAEPGGGEMVPVRPAGPMPPPSLDQLAGNPALAAALPPEAARALHAQCVTVLAALLPCLFLPASAAETPVMPETAALTPQDAATRFNVPKRWLLAHAHEIPGAVALSRKTIRFDAVRLARWLERHRKAS